MENEDKKKTYTPAAKNAIYKYRSKNVEKYNEIQRQYYEEAKTDEEWRKKFNERCKLNNQKYREKKKQLLGENAKPKGRPRKVVPPLNIANIAANIIVN